MIIIYFIKISKCKHKNIGEARKIDNMSIELNIGIRLTNTAINQIEKLFGVVSDYDYSYGAADILEQIFEDEYYDYYLQNATRGEDEETKVRILMSNDTDNRFNLSFISNHDNKILAVEGVNIDDKNFLITNVKLFPKNVGSDSNKSIFAKVKFYPHNNIKSSAIPKGMIEQLAQMPNAQELYRKVDKNIKDWDNYLAIIEEGATNSQIEIEYTGFKQQDSLTHCVFYFNKFNAKQIEKLKKFRNERVVLFYKKKINDETNNMEIIQFEDEEKWEDIEDFIGIIDKINLKNNTIKVELEPEFQELALEGELNFPQIGNLRISKMGDLAQARNLRRGLNLLRTGQARNPDLDVILFNSKTLGDNIENKVILEENNLLLKTLNEKQKVAVEGVLSAKDLFLIQGPPGTGKTTVIAEICYQNAIRGKKTLISSQSNLAVDNALSRLIHNPKIRVLRKGNLSRVEKEGEKYTENNVVDTWLNKTADSCTSEFQIKQKLLDKLNVLETQLDKICSLYSMKNNLEISILDSERDLKYRNQVLEEILELQNNTEQYFSKIEDEIWIARNIYGFPNNNSSIINILHNFMNIIKTKISINVNSYNVDIVPYILQKEFKNIYDQIEKGLTVNYTKQVDKKELEQNIEWITKIKKCANKGNISDIKNEVYKCILKSNEEVNQYLHLIEKEDCSKKNIINKISLLKELKSKIDKSLNYLEILRNEYKINDIVVAEQVLNNDIKKEEVIKFEGDVASLYNFKPNKFIMFLGFKKKWKVDVLTKLNIGQSYQACLVKMIDKLQDEKKLTEDNIELYIDEFVPILNQIDNSYRKKLRGVENDITSNVNFILDLKTQYEENKDKIVSEMIKKASLYKLILLIHKASLDKQVNEKNSLINELIVYNSEINTIFNKNLKLHEIAELKDIRKFYQDILISTKEVTANYVEIVGEWIKRIKQKKYGDKNELKDLYINTANVIGITCVQSGNRDFTEKYPDFDVVIVDEVSKATPPELVLPMLKGKKLVLVGDHKQLPPMIGSETFEELKVMSNQKVAVDSEIDDLEYMKRSLFEELFTNVSEKNKVMLNTQYRMHSSIMHTINQFYIDSENNGLICGVQNEEITKNHKLNMHYLSEKNNLLWVDIPLHPNYFEKENGQKSCYNETEVEVIDKMLKDINENCKMLGQKKEVAVITFYSAQARLLQKLIEKYKNSNIKLRIGTVDRFQGMEREIVIVSFVRNNNQGKIGFAKDSKRINVALSRAQNLLVIVGCSELFCEKNRFKEARESYKNVLKVVDSYNGIIDAKEIFN